MGCNFCGEKIEGRLDKRYCSRRCKELAKQRRKRQSDPDYENRRARERYHKLMEEVIKPARSCGCSICGCMDDRVLDFHHIGEKEFNVTQFSSVSRRRLEAEIAKCIVVCSNCHRVLHSSEPDTPWF